MPPTHEEHSDLLLQTETLPEARARFCWSDSQWPNGLNVRLFRREFELSALPKSLRIFVTADSRYILWLNGIRIGRGPLKGTPEKHHAETYELAPLLRAGKNTLAAEVRWFGRYSPTWLEHSHQAGFYVQSYDNDFLDTPNKWYVFEDHSVEPHLEDPFKEAVSFLGPTDFVKAGKRPKGWNTTAYSTNSDWKQAVAVGSVPRDNGWGVRSLHTLYPRNFPALLETEKAFTSALVNRRPSSLPWKLSSSESGEIWLDAGALTTSYPQLHFKGGKGRTIRICYAESLGKWEETNGSRRWKKQDTRNDTKTLEPHGYADKLELPGGDFLFDTFHWRTFWFLKIEVEAGSEPVELVEATHRFTTHPQSFSARFTCGDPQIEALWEKSLRTLALCAHETYEDCPYFEQLNYMGDTRLQALCSFYLANETNLAQRCLTLFRDSQDWTGLTASRTPSKERQVIPIFSLHWILALEDYWNWCGEGETEFVRSCLDNVDAVLSYFRRKLLESGFVGPLEKWAWTDWVPSWPKGVAPSSIHDSGSTISSAVYAYALGSAIRLHQQVGNPGDAERWIPLREKINAAIRRLAWDEERGHFIEVPNSKDLPSSQLAQIYPVLCGAATESQTAQALEGIFDDSLVPVSLFHSFYLSRALEKGGRYEAFFTKVLAPWREMLAKQLSTWSENKDPTRSDCHAWSSWMIIDFFSCHLGAKPKRPGWTEIEIKPQYSATNHASGSFDTPRGLVSISWRHSISEGFQFEAKVPPSTPTTVWLPNGEAREYRGEERISIEAPIQTNPEYEPLPNTL